MKKLNRMKKLVLILIVVLTGTNLFAQDARAILKAAGEAFRKHENLNMEVAVYTYEKENSAASLVGKGKMSKSDKGYYSRFMNDELISNKNGTVILNHEQKTMHYFEGENNKAKKGFVPQPDSLSAGDSAVYLGMENGLQHVLIYHRNSYIERTEVFINASTSLLSRIVYYYPPANEEFTADAYKSEVIYEKINFDKANESLFEIGRFVDKKNKTWVATAAWSKYALTVVTAPEKE
jgi:hypothetical protein